MKIEDIVTLKEDKTEYKKLGIDKENAIGGICSKEKSDGKWKVMFWDKNKILTESVISEEAFRICELLIPEEDLEILRHSNSDKKVSFDGEEIPNYTRVELMVDKPMYNKHGVNKGRQGTVIEIMGDCYFLVDFGPKDGKERFIDSIGIDLRIVKD